LEGESANIVENRTSVVYKVRVKEYL